MADNDNGAQSAVPYFSHFAGFLEAEGITCHEAFGALVDRLRVWGDAATMKAATNEFNPIILLEQVRREFDPSVEFVPFALACAVLQWGPRQMAIGPEKKPMWVIALEGFPKLLEAVTARVNDGK